MKTSISGFRTGPCTIEVKEIEQSKHETRISKLSEKRNTEQVKQHQFKEGS